MKYEIDIDMGKFSAEWECIAIRVATQEDAFITSGGVVSEPCQAGSFRTIYNEPRIIVRRRWQWPEWLTAEWIAMDFDGSWWCYSIEPQLDESFPKVWSGSLMKRTWLLPDLVAFTPPPGTDWRQSKRRNPSANATT